MVNDERWDHYVFHKGPVRLHGAVWFFLNRTDYVEEGTLAVRVRDAPYCRESDGFHVFSFGALPPYFAPFRTASPGVVRRRLELG